MPITVDAGPVVIRGKMVALGAVMLMLGQSLAGCTAAPSDIASFGDRTVANTDAAQLARRATKALARHDPLAVGLAEAAVVAAPGIAEYRVLLGQIYLRSGRFVSARDAFRDAMALQPANGRAALNLALAQIATGDWATARQTLAMHSTDIGPADFGLALALAGDPAGAVALLMQAARQPGADAKLRQNLALSLALGGEWQMARAVAAVDLSAADVDARMQEWIALAQPGAASDQVAALLGVRAVVDNGQPVALALAPPTVEVAAPAPVEPVVSIRFGPRREVVQPLPAPRTRLARKGGSTRIAALVR